MTIYSEIPCSFRSANRLSTLCTGVLIILCCLLTADAALSQDGASQADEKRMVSRFETAKADEDQTTALKKVLEYAKHAYGEDAPDTIKLMHRYGYSLYKDGK